MTRRDTYEDELRDPGLAALLREAYADDPALEASPGRTERIMRLVLAEGHTRPAPRARVWAPLAWAVGAVASAAAGVALIIMLATPHGAADLLASFKPAAPTPYVTPAPVRHTPRAAGHDTAPAPIPSVDVTNDGPAPTWENAPDDGQPTAPGTNEPAQLAESNTYAAAALYSAGSAATAVGDNKGAYEAYKASYETMPTPDALLASGDALYRLAQDSLDADTPQG